jgi:biotin carboxylase
MFLLQTRGPLEHAASRGCPRPPPEEVWERTMRAAAKLAKEVEYVNAGTVEHLFSETPDDIGNPFFLELS